MIVGSLEMQLMANVARLQKDMAEAKRAVTETAKAMSASADFIRGIFDGIAAGLSVHAFVSWIKGAIDAGDATKEFAQQTGVAAKDVAGLQLAFKQGNVDGETLTKAIGKMSKQMAEGNAMFETLGVKTRNANGTLRNVKDVLYDVADATAELKDGAAKDAAVFEIFGKQGLALIPTLNEGADGMREMAAMAEKLGLVIDEETAEAADKFNDTTELLGLGLQGVARKATAQLLPALNSLTGGFLEAMTQGDALKQASDVLAAGLKGLYSVVVVGGQLFNTIGKTVGAVAAQIVAVASGEFREAIKIGDAWKADIKGDWMSTVKNIGDVWSGAAAEGVDAMAKVAKQQKDLTLLTKEQEAAAKKHAEEVAKLTEKLEGQIAAQQLELDQAEKLTPMQKQALELMVALRDGTLQLTNAEKRRLTQQLETLGVQERHLALQVAEAKLQEEIRKDRDDAIVALAKQTTDLTDAVKAQREQNLELQLGAAGYAALQVQRLLDTAAQLEQTAATSDQSDELRKQAALLRERASLLQDGVVLKEARAAADEWAKTTEQIGQGLTDSLFRAFESGKSFASTFWQGIVNTFKTTILQPTIRAVLAPATGGIGSLFGAGGASASTGGGGALGGIGSLLGLGGGSFGSGLGAGLSSVFGESGFLGGMSAGTTALGAGNIMGGLGTLVGTAAPYVLAAVAAATLLKKAFGMGPKTTTATGISGTAVGGTFAGVNFSDWTKQGGWLRRDKSGTDTSALGADQAAAFGSAAGAVLAQAQAYATALQLPAAGLARVSAQIRVQLGSDEAANQKAIADAFAGYQDKLTAQFAALLVPYQRAGEKLTETFGRLAGLETFSDSINQLGGVFSRVARLSVDARENLIELAGGMEALGTQARSYVENYYSRDELAGLKAKEIRDVLAQAGITQDIGSRDQFRSVVDGLDVSTEAGRKQLAALLGVSGSFAGLTDYLAETGKTLDSTAAQAPAFDALGSLFSQASVDQVTAINAVQTSVDQVTAAVQALQQQVAATPPANIVINAPGDRWEVSTGGL